MLFLFHTTSYLSTTEPLGTFQEREMVVAVVELTVTLGWPGTVCEERVDIHHSPHVKSGILTQVEVTHSLKFCLGIQHGH